MAMRSASERKLDSVHKLEHQRDVWVATADVHGRPHLVPFSLSWDGEHIIVATELGSKTGQNISKYRQARLAIGDTRDVLIVEARVEIVPTSSANSSISEVFLRRNGWDPRQANGNWAYFIMTPTLMQAWSSEEEIQGRTIMRKGIWVDDSAQDKGEAN